MATITKTTLAMKDIVKLAGVLGTIMAALAWIHAEVTIPHVLTKTGSQTQSAIDRHAKHTHDGSLTQREFRLWAEMREKSTKAISDQLMGRLDRIERKIK